MKDLYKPEEYVESLVDIKKLLNSQNEDPNEPFKFDKDIHSFDDKILENRRGICYGCPDCGESIQLNSISSINRHNERHLKAFIKMTSHGYIYDRYEQIKVKKLAKKRMFDKSLSLYSREYAVFFYLFAIYSIYYKSCIKIRALGLLNYGMYVTEYVIVNIEEFPVDLIPYILKSYGANVGDTSVYRKYLALKAKEEQRESINKSEDSR